MMKLTKLILTTLLATLGCAGDSTAIFRADGLLALGNYGGDSTGMIVGDTAVHLHIACTFGDVSGRIAVDDHGRFDAAGSYTLHAFPVAVGPSVPARFVGQLSGNSVVITVTVNDTVGHAVLIRGPVTLVLGASPRDMPCPICRRPIRTNDTVEN